MKKNIYILGLTVLSLCAACEDNDSPLEMNDFSDISFINSQTVNQYSTNVIEIGDPISFMDMSQNTVSHSWTIDEGCRFIRGEYTREDTVFTQFIIPEATKTSEEKTVYVLFEEPGDKQVRLYNTFNDSVSYHGLSAAAVDLQRFPGDANRESYFDEEEGVWVFDTLMTFKVLDKVNARIHAYQEDALVLDIPKEETPTLADTLSWPTVTLGVGDTLTLTLDTYGEPDEIEWALTSALEATPAPNDSEVLQTSPKIERLSQDFIATKMGRYRAGRVNVVRTDGTSATQTTELQPAGKINKIVPMYIQVTAPSAPLVASNMKVTTATTLTFSFSGEIPTLPENVASEFSLQVANTDKGLAATTINVTDVTLDNSTSTVTLTLESPVYSDDDIQLIYTGEDIVDIYGRSLEQIDATITDYYSAVISDPVKRGFEGAIKNNKAIDGWFIQHYPIWSVTTDKVHSGARSLVFDSSKITKTLNVISCQSSAGQSEFAGPAGTYIVSAYVWKASGSIIDNLYFTFQFPNKQNILDISDIPFDSWHKVSISCDIPGELIVAKTKLNLQVPGTSTGMMYIDDIEVETDTTRPIVTP